MLLLELLGLQGVLLLELLGLQGVLLLELLGLQGVLLLGLQGVLLLELLGFQPDLAAIIWTYDTPSFLLLTKEVVTDKYPSVVTKTLSHLSFNFY